MTKAQGFFGGTKPKATGSKVRQAGYSIGQKGSPWIKSGGGKNTGQAAKNNTAARKELGVPHGSIERKTTVKQAGHTTKGSGNTHQQVRDARLSTKDASSRPKLAGKEDNRTSWR